MSDIQFVEGLIVKAPSDRAPEYVKAGLSIKREELIAWLQQQDGEWINADVKEARSGKWYVAVNNFRANSNGTPRQNAPRATQRPAPATQAPVSDDSFADDDIPFLTFGGW